MLLTASSTANYSPCPAGAYLARCILIADLGTVQTDWQGQTKHARKVLLSWEILDDEARRDDGEPFILSKRYTASLHEKAALRKDLASWRGRDFTAEELAGFDLKNILGQPCMLSVVHQDKDGRTFANIAAIMKTPKGSAPPPASGALVHWAMDTPAPDWEAFARLPKRIAEQVQAAPEFARLSPPKSVSLSAPAAPSPTPAPTAPRPAPAPAAPVQTYAPAGAGFADFEDDIPFDRIGRRMAAHVI